MKNLFLENRGYQDTLIWIEVKLGTTSPRLCHIDIESSWNLKLKFQKRIRRTLFCLLMEELQPLFSYGKDNKYVYKKTLAL